MRVTNEILAMFPVKGKAILADLMKRIELKPSENEETGLEVNDYGNLKNHKGKFLAGLDFDSEIEITQNPKRTCNRKSQ